VGKRGRGGERGQWWTKFFYPCSKVSLFHLDSLFYLLLFFDLLAMYSWLGFCWLWLMLTCGHECSSMTKGLFDSKNFQWNFVGFFPIWFFFLYMPFDSKDWTLRKFLWIAFLYYNSIGKHVMKVLTLLQFFICKFTLASGYEIVLLRFLAMTLPSPSPRG
jgi:hypothetical protein